MNINGVVIAPGWYCDKGGTQRVEVLRHRAGSRVVFVRERDPYRREVRCTEEQFRLAFVAANQEEAHGG